MNNDNKQDLIDELCLEVEELQAEVATLRAENESLQGEVETLREDAESVEHRACDLLASTGHPPLNLGNDGGGAFSDGLAGFSVLEQYRSITEPRARTEFYRKNKAALIEAARQRGEKL